MKEATKIAWDADVEGALGMKPGWLKALHKGNIRTVGAVLSRYPRRYENREHFDRFPNGGGDEAICISGLVVAGGHPVWGGRRVFDATLEEEGGLGARVICRWFHGYAISKMIAVGQRVIVYGKPKLKGKKIYLEHPEFEILEEEEDTEAGASLHMKRIVPMYPNMEGMNGRNYREMVDYLLRNLDWDSVPDYLPAEECVIDKKERLQNIHFPKSFEALEVAHGQVVLEELFLMQLVIGYRRKQVAEKKGRSRKAPGYLAEDFRKSLPFPLTGAQERCIQEIVEDMASDHAMNRLLQGDVGSGKTFVAMAAALHAVEAGYQVALMAPTQILAEQHYLNFQRWLHPLDIRLALRTGNRKEESIAPLFAGGAEPQIVIGTHALLFESFRFENLGLVVIDEQHKFGVMQRARLIEQGQEPDVLVMTATPIPRTLAMTVYGDLAVSIIDELPPGRGKVITAIRDEKAMPKVLKFLREEMERGRQFYVVCSLIDEGEKQEVKAVESEYKRWVEWMGADRCELLHGRMSGEEKEAVMKRFREGDIAVLVSTTVIEVGVDVPNANIMMIQNADRFGLAQLHQLRGRIGRGEHKSYCILMVEKEAEGREKLEILEKTHDGFQISEEDFNVRGAGDLLGTAQSGIWRTRLADLRKHAHVMYHARDLVQEILLDDPELQKVENEQYRAYIVEIIRQHYSEIS